MKTENLIKASQTADFLVNELQAAHRDAIGSDPFAEMVLMDLIKQACEIHGQIQRSALAATEQSI